MFRPNSAALAAAICLNAFGIARGEAPRFDPKPVTTLELPAGEAKADGTFNHVAFSPDGRLLAASSWGDPRIRVWDAQSKKLVATLTVADTDGAGPLAWSADSKLLATTNAIGQRIHVYEIPGGQILWETKAVGIKTYAMAFSPDGKFLATVAGRNDVRLLSADTGREKKLESSVDGVIAGTTLAFADGGLLVTFGKDNNIPTVLAADTLKPVKAWIDPKVRDSKGFAHERGASLAAVAPDGKSVASCDYQDIRFWNLAEAKVTVADVPDVGKKHMAFTGDGRMLVIMSNNEAKMKAVDPATGRPCGGLDRGKEAWNSLAFSKDGLMAVGAAGQKVHLFTVPGAEK